MTGLQRQSSRLSTESPGARRASSLSRDSGARRSSQIRDSRFSLDNRTCLKVFRLIGGFDGIQIDEFRKAIGTVRDPHIRSSLTKNLVQLFAQFDEDDNGILDFLEFEQMVKSSTIAQQAVYELLERAEHEERNGEMMVDDPDSSLWWPHGRLKYIDLASVIMTLLYMVNLTLQADLCPEWSGWPFVEVGFLIAFTVEIIARYLSVQIWNVLGIFDLVLLITGWLELCMSFSDAYGETGSIESTGRWIRILRMARCTRLIRVFWYCHDLRVLLEGILSGMRSAFWGVALVFLIVFAWAIAIRTAVANNWTGDSKDIVSASFTNTPESMLIVFRCMALSADGACMEKPQDLGLLFNVLWAASEAFILVGILNVIVSVYVVQAEANAKKIKQSINNVSFHEDVVRLQKLDKLLRTLIKPDRESNNHKVSNAAAVATMLHTEHPEAAAKIPNLEQQLVHFAQNIHDAKNLHQSAMDIYESQEVLECKQLRSIPSAMTYMVGDEEVMLVDDVFVDGTSSTIPAKPSDAVEVCAVQEQHHLDALLEEAHEVQQFVKGVIHPNSSWAVEPNAGSSGNIWKSSKGLCDEAIDPGIKSVERIQQKVATKYEGRYERNRDYCRLSLVYNSVGHMIQAIPRFLEYRLETDCIQVIKLENRFSQPHPLGWRDITMLLKVRVQGRSGGHSHHIMELQFRLKGLAEVCYEGHKFYEAIRANLPGDLVLMILDRLVTDTTLDLGITKSEWAQCLPNKEVKKLLDDMGIPRRNRRVLFDTIDIDGSGTVTSAELQEMLLLVKEPVHAYEVAGCHFRVRDIQRQLQTRLEPQIATMHNQVVKVMEDHACVLDELFVRIDENKEMVV